MKRIIGTIGLLILVLVSGCVDDEDKKAENITPTLTEGVTCKSTGEFVGLRYNNKTIRYVEMGSQKHLWEYWDCDWHKEGVYEEYDELECCDGKCSLKKTYFPAVLDFHTDISKYMVHKCCYLKLQDGGIETLSKLSICQSENLVSSNVLFLRWEDIALIDEWEDYDFTIIKPLERNVAYYLTPQDHLATVEVDRIIFSNQTRIWRFNFCNYFNWWNCDRYYGDYWITIVELDIGG